MSQPVRRTLAALGLMVALLFMTPAPSRAAGLREIPARSGLTARLSAWLEGLLPRATSPRPAKSPSHPAPSPSKSSDQGSAIDPNGTHK
jgi:hypothetical protein